jgi:hypothetical protein
MWQSIGALNTLDFLKMDYSNIARKYSKTHSAQNCSPKTPEALGRWSNDILLKAITIVRCTSICHMPQQVSITLNIRHHGTLGEVNCEGINLHL